MSELYSTLRGLAPERKLVPATALREADATSSLGLELGIENLHQSEIYHAMDWWLYKRQVSSDGDPVTSFQGLVAQLGKFKLALKNPSKETIYAVLDTLSARQKKAFKLIGVQSL